MSTIYNITGATKSTALKRTVNPANNEELIISYGNISFVVSKRAWNMLSINAPVKRIVSTSEVRI